MEFFMVVTAAVTPMANDAATLQGVIGFLIMVILGIIAFYVGRLYISIGQLYDLTRNLGGDLAKLRGEHDMVTKRGHK